VKNPTARCAMGDTRSTTRDSVTTFASFHHPISGYPGPGPVPAGPECAAPDLTAELCEGYRRTLWIPECS
jgi:hypothetical protein